MGIKNISLLAAAVGSKQRARSPIAGSPFKVGFMAESYMKALERSLGADDCAPEPDSSQASTWVAAADDPYNADGIYTDPCGSHGGAGGTEILPIDDKLAEVEGVTKEMLDALDARINEEVKRKGQV